MEQFSPQVVVDGVSVTPESWMWVLAFALNGVPWAVEEAAKPEFRTKIDDYLKRREIYHLNEAKQNLQSDIENINSRLEKLNGIR